MLSTRFLLANNGKKNVIQLTLGRFVVTLMEAWHFKTGSGCDACSFANL